MNVKSKLIIGVNPPPLQPQGFSKGAASTRGLILNVCFLFFMFCYQNTFGQTGNWNGSTTVTTTTPNDVGIGTTGPDGKTEIFIDCPAKNGLIITKDENCPLPYANPTSGLNAEVHDPGSGPNEPTFTVPFSFNVGSTLPMTPLGIGGFTSPIANNPLIWVRTKDINSSGALYSSTRFVVMPDGKVGFNVYNPRATLDVRNMNAGHNLPAAIFGVNEYSTSSGLAGNKQYKTRHVQIVPKCAENGYNEMTKLDDLGIFFTNGKGIDGANQTLINGGSGLIIAPWAASNNAAIGGIRIDADGNVEVHSKITVAQINVNALWWCDFVFAPDYKPMSLPELELFIKTKKHLPGMPTEKEALDSGINVADIQARQLQKIEELTLYAIDQNKKLAAQQVQIDLLRAKQEELVRKLELILKK